MLKFWLNRAYVSAAFLIVVAIGSYAGTIPTVPVLDSLIADSGWKYTLYWNASAGASSYALQTSTDYYFATTLFSQTGITGTSLTLTDSAKDTVIKYNWNNGYCYWRMNAANIYGVSEWSSVDSSFGAYGMCNWVGGVYGPSPGNAATNVSLPVTFGWDGPELQCSVPVPSPFFILQVSTDTGFSSLVIENISIYGTLEGASGFEEFFRYFYSTGYLNNSTTYYWRLRVGGGPWLDTFKFTTGGTSVLPVDGKLSKTDFTASNKMISYSLATPGPVEITFSDVLGRTAFVVNRKQSVGRYSIELKNCNLASGHYIVSFKAAGVEKQASVVITR